ncbi:tetratricopeptide repeat-containing sensor histidine kinase [Spirosoma luteum]|uniref:tetratricopeptide repeat-containing sensor histidine kinase n=1 Tax=Spirosoma luteum TaxID=431553 RepID=UPI00036818BE|nr:tetratricopeptide repeat-containing sensor histidine kinase [Spirosoma luteum]
MLVMLDLLSAAAQPGPSPSEVMTVKILKQIPPSFGRDTALVIAYNVLAGKYMANDLKRGKSYADSALAITEHINWQKGIASTYMSLAAFYGTTGYWDKANTLIQQSIQISKQLGDKQGELAGLLELGVFYWDVAGNYEKSLALFNTCLPMAAAQKDSVTLMRVYYQMGLVYGLKKDYKRALLYFNQFNLLIERSLTGAYRHNQRQIWSYNVAQIYLLTNRTQEAETMLTYTMPTIEKGNNIFEKYFSNWTISSAYIQLEEYKEAKIYAVKAAYYAQFIPSRAHNVYINTLFYKIYKGLNQPVLALKHLVELRRLENEIASDKTSVKIEELQLRYNTKAQQEQINELTIARQEQTQNLLLLSLLILVIFSSYGFWNNRQLRQKNHAISMAQLKGQTIERKRVAADLHDNLGTTLAALHWNLEAMDTTKLSAVEKAVYATFNQQVSQAYNDVRLISHNLLPDELAKQGLAVALTNLVDKMNRNTPVRFYLSGTDTLARLDGQMEFELYSICLELLNNTIKHAYATEGSVHLTQANSLLQLTVGDNGAGLTHQQKDGRGLHNIAARVESLRGTWVVDSTPVGGLQHRIVVPVRTPARASSQT